MLPSSEPRGLSAVLADLSDIDIIALLAEAEPLAIGIGGSTSRACVQGSVIFVKRLPLTAIEKDDPTSTSNRFNLPVSCHYGIGSPGFGVGREIATHEFTSNWVASGVTLNFPVLYHWRALDQRCTTDVSEFDGDGPRRQWGADWSRVRDRVEALTTARWSIVLFLEYVPDTLDTWLREQFRSGAGAVAFSTAIQQIVTATGWMRAHGMQHLDIHLQNILVRDGCLLFTDFGLALHQSFALDQNERAFFATHGGYDHDTGISSLLHWVLAELGVRPHARRLEVLRAFDTGHHPAELDLVRAELGTSGVDLIAQYAGIGATTTALFDALMRDASTASYSPIPE